MLEKELSRDPQTPVESHSKRRPAERKIDIREVNSIVRDLLKPNPLIFWPDLILSSGIGWGSFLLGVFAIDPVSKALFGLIAVFALFRCLFFIHELTHISDSDLPGFRLGWNLLVGIPMMVPSITYEGVHLDHHKRPKYGTIEDPEYLPLGKGSFFGLLIFMSKTLIFPLAFAVRFLILAPIGLLIPKFHRFLEVYASSLIINERYKRKTLSDQERRHMIMVEIAILIFWAGLITLYVNHILPTTFFRDWYLTIFGIAFINQLRTLVAHRYMNDKGEMEYEDQLLDSVNVEGGKMTELWAPVGARFHALHHYVPKLPYHSLPEAHRRMKNKFSTVDDIYKAVNEASFASAIGKLIKSTRKSS